MSTLRDRSLTLLSDWLTLHQALAWVRYRDADFASSADPDALAAALIWPADYPEPVAGRSELLAALRDRTLIAEGSKAGREWAVIPSPQWATLDIVPRDPARHLPYEQIRVARVKLLALFPPISVARASHAEVVAWCRNWIKAGKGNGEAKAWPSFRAEPQHVGLSRDDNFRPAWTEAKGAKAPVSVSRGKLRDVTR